MKYKIMRRETPDGSWVETGETYDDKRHKIPVKAYLAKIKRRDGFEYRAERAG